MREPPPHQPSFPEQVAKRFRLVPNFFVSTPDAPEIIERLWGFAAAAYLDNPIPTLFKERLFVFLSRFCPVRYCIVRHCGFLLGYGQSAGDSAAEVQTIEQVMTLLQTPPPWRRDLEPIYSSLEGMNKSVDWPTPDAEIEDQLFSVCALIFVNPMNSERAQKVLRHSLGGKRCEYVLALWHLSELPIFGRLSITPSRSKTTSNSSWTATQSLRPCCCKNPILGCRDRTRSNVRCWHLADMSKDAFNVRFRG